MKPDGTGPYRMFTPYYRTAMKIRIAEPDESAVKFVDLKIGSTRLPSVAVTAMSATGVTGGRTAALTRLAAVQEGQYKQYGKQRDQMTYETTMLSAYHKFGCVSMRESYKAMKGIEPLRRQLYWRDFYHQILYYYPHVLGAPMREQYSRLKWSESKTAWERWTTGTTGIPIVDAAMRQLNQTGFMHNRGRMIVSNFLIKLLRIDWRRGEQYFAQQLTDYDVAVNNGSWQWSASTGTDSQPYYRIFNPWRQAEKYDKDCVYIRRWIPELDAVPTADILRWNVAHVKHLAANVDYPAPMIGDIQAVAKKTVAAYSAIASS